MFWLAVVRDASSNRIVGRRCSDRCDTDLILGALEYAIWTRNAHSGQVIHHSDRGSNYTSLRSDQRIEDHGILPSMGSAGSSYDNALMENFFPTLKIEPVYRNSWRSREEAENTLFAYIDAWYNTERIQARHGGSRPTSTSPPGPLGRPCWTINPHHPPMGPTRPRSANQHSEPAGDLTVLPGHRAASP